MCRTTLRSVAVVAVAGALTLAPSASAGYLPTHAFVGSSSLDGYDPNFKLFTAEGSSPLDTGFHSGYWDARGVDVETRRSSAWASTSVSADNFLRAYSSAGSELLANMSGEGVAAWRDITFLSSGSQSSVLRLNFSVDGNLTVAKTNTVPNAHSNWAQLGLTLSSDPINFFTNEGGTRFNMGHDPLAATDYSGNQQQGEPALPIDFEGYIARADDPRLVWDSAAFDGSHFTGAFHIDSA